MVQPVSPAGADDGHVIHVLRNVRQPVGNPNAALAMLLERPFGWHQGVAGGAHRGDDFAKRFRHRLARQFVERRLRVKQIEMARSAFHEQPDNGLRACWKMRGARRQRVERINLEVRGAGQQAVQTEQVAKRQRAAAAAAFGQEFTTGSGGEDVRLSRHAVVTR